MVFSLPDAIAKILEKHIKRADKQLALNLPASPLETSIKIEEKITETVTVEEKIKTNGELTYKSSQKISIANLGNAPVCPSCTNMMVLAEGCMKCEHCGYSKCG